MATLEATGIQTFSCNGAYVNMVPLEALAIVNADSNRSHHHNGQVIIGFVSVERVPATITLFEDGSRAIGCHNLSDTGYCLAPYMGDYGGNKYRNPPRNICPHLRPIHSAVLDRLDR